MKYLTRLIQIIFFLLFVFLIQRGKMLLWLAIYAISLLLALVFGRIYCGYICPMNTLMIPTEWLSKKLNLQTDRTPKWLQSAKVAWISMFVSIALMLFAKRVLNKNIPILLIWLFISVIITLRYKPSIFHNLLCPFGPLQKIFGKLSLFSEVVYTDGCIGCKKCEGVCPSNAISVKSEDKKAVIDTGKCFQCTNCSQICPSDTIHYSRNKKGKTSTVNI